MPGTPAAVVLVISTGASRGAPSPHCCVTIWNPSESVLCPLFCLPGAGLLLGKKVASREDVLDSGKPAKLIILSVATGLVSLVRSFLPRPASSETIGECSRRVLLLICADFLDLGVRNLHFCPARPRRNLLLPGPWCQSVWRRCLGYIRTAEYRSVSRERRQYVPTPSFSCPHALHSRLRVSGRQLCARHTS